MPSPRCQYSDEELLNLSLDEASAPELSSHLEQCASCQDRLQQLQKEISTLTEALESLSSTDGSSQRRQEDLPATIGKYYVVGKLGQGGQAEVYRAMHPELNIEVAIKIGHQPVLADKERDLLIREARLLVSLNHPDLVRVRDLDFHNGRPFLVMDFIKGTNLEKFAREKPLGPRPAAALAARLARAMAAVHRQGVLHQDLKPTNILIDAQGQPHLVDFGIARLRDLWACGTAPPLGGTPAYMAPEQAGNRPQDILPQTDVFALGGILFFLLTGQAPFQGDSWEEVRGRIERGDIERDALLQPQVPGPLRAICLRALAPASKDRYASMEDLAAALERYAQRPQRLRRRLAAAFLVGLLALGLWLLRPTGPDVSPALAHNQFLLARVERQDQVFHDFRQALPLRTGDGLVISCKVPPGFQPALFALDTAGEVRELEPQIDGDMLYYPPRGKIVRLQGAPGTEFLLVCAHAQVKPRRQDIVALLEPGPWPALPGSIFLHLTPEKVVLGETVRGLDTTEETNLSRVEGYLEDLQKKLRSRYDFFVGVAIPHRALE